MKLKITLISDKKIELPTGFSSHIQAIVYNFLDRVSAEWLHEKGFKFEKRSFKLFTYSSLHEKPKYLKEKKQFVFPNEVSFTISSPVNWLIEQVAKNIVISEQVKIGHNVTTVSSVEIFEDEKIKNNKQRIQTVCPIEVHSTLLKADSGKKTYYYSPSEREFQELINKNLQKKWTAFYQKDCPYNLKIKPVRLDLCKENKRTFKGIIIKGWTGHFWIEGEPEFLRFGLMAGLGSRSSQGFGMVEIVNKK
jgi:CRISPR-associated endoribonuclease Cas6